jgi:hypothetical protein
MGPPSRSLAADAHGCIMVRILEDTSSTIHRIQGCGAMAPPRAGSTQIVSSALASADGPSPPDSWLSIGAGPSTDAHRKTEQVEGGLYEQITT